MVIVVGMQMGDNLFGNLLPPPGVVQVAEMVAMDFSQLIQQGNCSAQTDLAVFQQFQIPWFVPGASYCNWLGVQCCMAGMATERWDHKCFC